MKQPYFENKHYTLKLLEVEKADLLLDYYQRNREYFAKWEPLRGEEFYTLKFWQQQVEQSLELFTNKHAVRLLALTPNQDKVIASCNFSNIVHGCFQACHLGYSIDKNFEGKSIMYSILNDGIGFMKNEMKLHRIMANHLPNNLRSENILKRLGFSKEGYAEQYLKINGQWQDHILNALVLY